MTSLPTALFPDHGFVLEDARVVYWSMPKVACSSLKWQLAEIQGEQLVAPGSELYAPELIGGIHDRGRWQATPRVADVEESPLLGEEWFRFTVVRDPVERLFSAWQSKILGKDVQFCAWYPELTGFRTPRTPGDVVELFSTFVDLLLDERHHIGHDAHFLGQAEQLSLSGDASVRIYDLRDLDRLREDLRDHLAVGGRELPGLRRLNESVLPIAARHLPAALVRRIAAAYEADYAAFTVLRAGRERWARHHPEAFPDGVQAQIDALPEYWAANERVHALTLPRVAGETGPLQDGPVPEVAVVLPTFNGASWMESALAALADQTLSRERYEVVVVENGPRAGVEEEVARARAAHPGLRLRYLHSELANLSAARNTGLDHVRAPYVTFVDDDDRVGPDYLRALLEVAAPDVVGGVLVGFVNESDFTVVDWDNYVASELIPRLGQANTNTDLQVFLAYPWAKIVSTTLARAVRFDPSLRAGEDTIFWTTLACTHRVRLRLSEVQEEAAYLYNVRAGSLMRFEAAPDWDFGVARRVDVLHRFNAIAAVDAEHEEIRQARLLNHCHAFVEKLLRHRPDLLPRVIRTIRQQEIAGTPWSLPEGTAYREAAPVHPTVPRADGRPWISVVVPSYRGEQWVAGCLDSLAGQTLDPACFEVLLVQNGPQTGTREVVSSWRERHPRIRLSYLESEVASVTHARNLALDGAAGDYVTFVDDDDRVAPRFLEGLLGHAEPDAITVALGGWVENEQWQRPDLTHWAAEGPLALLGTAYDDGPLLPALQPAWGKLVATEHARAVRFDDRLARYADDTLFWATLYATRPVRLSLGELVAEAAYLYRVRSGSISAYGAKTAWDTHVELPLLAYDLMTGLVAASPRPEVAEMGAILCRAFVDRMNLHLYQHPYDLAAVVGELGGREVGGSLWRRLNRLVGEDLALVDAQEETAARMVDRGRVVDAFVYTHGATSAPAALDRVAGEMHIIAGTSRSAWGHLQIVLDVVLSRLLLWEAGRRRPYAVVHSCSSEPLVHLLAAMVKISRPQLRWTAEFLGDGLAGRGVPVEDDWVLQVLAAGLAEAGHGPLLEPGDLAGFTRLVIAGLADEVLMDDEGEAVGAVPSRLPA